MVEGDGRVKRLIGASCQSGLGADRGWSRVAWRFSRAVFRLLRILFVLAPPSLRVSAYGAPSSVPACVLAPRACLLRRQPYCGLGMPSASPAFLLSPAPLAGRFSFLFVLSFQGQAGTSADQSLSACASHTLVWCPTPFFSFHLTDIPGYTLLTRLCATLVTHHRPGGSRRAKPL